MVVRGRAVRGVLVALAGLGLGALVARRARRDGRCAGYRDRPLFALGYALFAPLAERGELGRRRQALLRNASGLVLDAGAGTGENFKHFPSSVTGVVALEPDRAMTRLARRHLDEGVVPARLVRAVMEDLPFADASFDSVVATLVLCTVDDPSRALAELRRVLRPGARLLLLEHVRSNDETLADWQDRLERMWARLNGGCRPNRPTMQTVTSSGFRLEAIQLYGAEALPHVQAVATRA